EAGLDVELQDLQAGGRALRALVGGSADVVCGFYDHTIQMQAQGRRLKMVVLVDRYPGLVLAVAKHAASTINKFADLKGKKVGVTAPGSSSHFFVNYLVQPHMGLDEFSVIAIGATSTAVATLRSGQVDAGAIVEPVVSLLQRSGDIKILADTRTTTGTLRTFGGPYPAGGLYATAEFIERNPRTAQALVTAVVKALRYVKTHSPEEIVSKMPPEFYEGDRVTYTLAVKNSLELFSPDGRMSPAGPPNVMTVLKFDRAVATAAAQNRINLADTYDMRFVEVALKQMQGAR
ncbi:MAG: ABC transporter substrate-binding protein, partial [Armatimonadetes bacterium]|nr:ABC transporter substrate-binding protein [Armatimonadota bacterium]